MQAVVFGFHPAQMSFLRSTATIRGYVGGRGAGKTRVGCYDLLKRARKGRSYMFASPTYPQLRETALRTFKEISEELGHRIASINHNEGSAKIHTEDGGMANISFRSTEREEFLRGPNLSGLWLDEASLMKEEAFDILLASLREGGQMGWVSMTFTPKGRHHWTYHLFHDGRMPSTHLAKSSTMDNPYLSREFIASMESRYRADKIAQELRGEFLDLSDQLISYDAMMDCTAPGCAWADGHPPTSTGLLYIGWDIARTKDRSVIWTWERVGDVAWCRECFVMHNVTYESQEQEIMKRVRRPNVARVILDAGFNPYYVERLQRELGSSRVEGVHLNSHMQGHLAELLADAFGRKTVRIPDNDEIRDDFAQVGQTQIKQGKVTLPADAVQRTEHGHADRFWAAALAYKGFSESAPAVRIAPPLSRVPSWR